MKTVQHFLLYQVSGFFLLSSRRAGWGRWSALRCSDVKLLLSAYRFFHVSFPSWEHKCSMLDNLLLSCLNVVSNTIDMLFNYKVHVLSVLAKAAVAAIFSQNRRLTSATNIVSCIYGRGCCRLYFERVFSWFFMQSGLYKCRPLC
jgi:hypothetical protein